MSRRLTTFGYCVAGIVAVVGGGLLLYRLLKSDPVKRIYYSIKSFAPLKLLYKEKIEAAAMHIPLIGMKGSLQEDERGIHAIYGKPGSGKTTAIFKWAASLEEVVIRQKHRKYKFIYVPFKHKTGKSVVDVIGESIDATVPDMETFSSALREYKRRMKKRLVLILDDFEYALGFKCVELIKEWISGIVFEGLADVLLVFNSQYAALEFLSIPSIDHNMTLLCHYKGAANGEFVSYLIEDVKVVAKGNEKEMAFSKINAELFYRTIGEDFNAITKLIAYFKDPQNVDKDQELRKSVLQSLASKLCEGFTEAAMKADLTLVGFILDSVEGLFECFQRIILKAKIAQEEKKHVFKILTTILENHNSIQYNPEYATEFETLFKANILDRDLHGKCYFQTNATRTMCVLCLDKVFL